MKRLGLAAYGLFLGLGSISAQNAYDAMNISRVDPVMGTARYSAMAGALGALGADASTMKDNPAGLGVYRKWDVNITPNIYVTNDNSVGLNVNNFGLVMNFGRGSSKKGYITSSLGISYNRLRNFDRYTSVTKRGEDGSMTDFMAGYASDPVYNEAKRLELLDGEDNSTYSPDDLISRRVRFDESGSLGEWNFSYGMNVSNFLYWGVGLGVTSLDYKQTAQYDEMSPSDGSWYLDNYYEATGSGFNFKAGVIIRPTDFFRVGLAFHSPTFYTIDQYSDQHMDFDGVNGSRHETEISATSLSYDLQTPLKAQASLGFVIGKRAIIGLEYQFEDYSAIRISDCEGVYSYYDGERLDRWTDHYVDFDKVDEKDRINEVLGVAHTIKLGAEVNVAKGFAVRLGTAFVTKPLTKEAGLDQNFPTDYPVSFPQNTFYVTGGWGYRGESFFVDMAAVYKNQGDKLYDFLPIPDDEKPMTDESLGNINVMATLGWKF